MAVVGYILFGIIAVLVCVFVFYQITGFVKDIKRLKKKKKDKDIKKVQKIDEPSVDNNNGNQSLNRLTK